MGFVCIFSAENKREMVWNFGANKQMGRSVRVKKLNKALKMNDVNKIIKKVIKILSSLIAT